MDSTFDELVVRVQADEFGWPARRSVVALSRRAQAQFTPRDAVARLVDAFAAFTDDGWDLSGQAVRSHRHLVGRAGLDLADEQAGLVRRTALINGPVHVGAGAWRGLRPGLRRLLAQDPAVRGGLADLILTRGVHVLAGGSAFWLPLLLDTGVLSDISTSPGSSPDELADLLEGWLADPASDDRLLDRAVRILGPGAAAAHRPLHPGATARGLNLAALDSLLGAGIEPDPGDRRAVDVRRWATDPQRSRLPNLPRGSWLDDLVEAGIDDYVDDPPRRGPALAGLLDTGLRPHVERWLRAHGDALGGDCSLVVAQRSLRQLQRALGRARSVKLPEIGRSLALLDLGDGLLRMLRAGLVDEFAWPALESALTELDRNRIGWSAGWPGLVIHDTRLALLVGPDSILARHRLRLPADLPPADGPLVAFAEGSFLVCRRQGDTVLGYWTSDPDTVFQLPLHWPADGPPDVFAAGIAHPDGLVLGVRALRRGATTIGSYLTTVGSDGESWWRVIDRTDERGTRVVLGERFDPVSGVALAREVPPPLAAYVTDGTGADLLTTELLPAAGAPSTSPLGWAPGWVGVLARQRLNDDAIHDIELRGPDGRTVRARLGAAVFNPYLVTSGILRFPESADDWLLVGDDTLLAVGDFFASAAFLDLPVGAVDPADPTVDRPAILGFVPPGRFWHHLTPRAAAVPPPCGRSIAIRSTRSGRPSTTIYDRRIRIGRWPDERSGSTFPASPTPAWPTRSSSWASGPPGWNGCGPSCCAA